MTPAAVPLSLQLPRDPLVLHPLHGNLEIEPVLLVPGGRYVIGSAENCAVRLTKSTLVRPEHCTIEVSGRQHVLTEWVPDVTWLNDRLVSEPCELVSGDRIAVGPFDFQVRAAVADELQRAKRPELKSGSTSNVGGILQPKPDTDGKEQAKQTAPSEINFNPARDLFRNSNREVRDRSETEGLDSSSPNTSIIVSDVQHRFLALHEPKAELPAQLRSKSDPPNSIPCEAERRKMPADSAARSSTTAVASPLDAIPAAVRPDYEQVLQLLKSARDALDRDREQLKRDREQLDQDRKKLADDQRDWREETQDWTERFKTLESQLEEVEILRQSAREERDMCRTLAAQLIRDETRMVEWEDRLRLEEQEFAHRRNGLSSSNQEPSPLCDDVTAPESTTTESVPVTLAGLVPRESASSIVDALTPAEDEVPTQSSRPIQTLLTLVAFGLAALFFSGVFGNQEVHSTLGWGTAVLGVISTVDLLLRRCFLTSR